MFIRCLNAKQGFLSFFVFQGGKLQVKSPPNGHLKNVKTFFNIRFWIITGTLIEKNHVGFSFFILINSQHLLTQKVQRKITLSVQHW